MIERTVIQRLYALAHLQQIDSRLDRIRQVRGGLPEEVRDLEDELEGLRTRLERLSVEIEGAESEIARRDVTIEESNDLIKRYGEQIMQVQNSREYEALQKEIELAQLEILTCQRRIKLHNEFIAEKQRKIDEIRAVFDERTNDLKEKNAELSQIYEETRIEEENLMRQSDEAGGKLEERLRKAYTRIRKNMRNGLSVVTMDRGACGGCFAIIPPQRQYEIRQKKKIIICENCGRILVDETFFTDAGQYAEQVAAVH